MTSHLERLPTSSATLTTSRPRASRSRFSVVSCLVLWFVFRLSQIALGCRGKGVDVELYRDYARALRSGATAQSEFQPEYPPGALTVFLVPALVGGDRYGRAFAGLAALFDLGACLLVFHRTRTRPQASPRAPFFHTSLYLSMTAMLWPVLYARFDIVPAALVLGALHCLDRHRYRASAAILGAAAAVKLWPFALLPVWMAWGNSGWRRSARGVLAHVLTLGVAVAAGVAFAVLPVLPLIAPRIGSSLRFHADRGLQIESTWASAVLVLDRLGWTEAGVEKAFGAVQLTGSLPEALVRLALPATFVLAGIPTAIAVAARWRAHSVEPGALEGPISDSGRALELAVLAITLGVLIASKVLSPQFLLWVAPLFALTVVSRAGFVLAFLTAALTTEIYPYLYPALRGRAPGEGWAIAALVARNALLVGWYVHATLRLAKQGGFWRRLNGGDRTLQGLVLPVPPAGEQPPGR